MGTFTFPKLTFWRGVFFIVLLAGLYTTVLRFSGGLGASTALSDQFPWGLWIGFDVLCGVALAAGGFTISAVVYIFNIERFRPIIRPAILTAFLGYSLVIVALLFDLGKPYNIWHPLVMWNPNSVMFEVAWCVMLYTMVLGLEFSPMLLERFGWQKPLKIVHALTLPLVILGVILSTLHQSSLGSLFLIVPQKLYPLWYSPLLPVYFFISAIALGCAMTIFESFLSYRAFRRHLELPLLSELGKVTVVVLGVYLVLKLQDLSGRGSLWLAFEPTYEGRMFLAEMLMGVVGPIILFSIPRIRTNHFGLFVSAVMVVLGFVMNRLNVSITGMEASSGVRYFPSWTEASVTLMIVALGFMLFGLAVKYLNVFPPETHPLGAGDEMPELPAPALLRQPLTSSTLLVLTLGGLVLITVLALGVSGLTHRQDLSRPLSPAQEDVDSGHGMEAFQTPPDITLPLSEGSPGPVIFNHTAHIDWGQPRCNGCHNQPYRILQASRVSSTEVAGRDMHSSQYCGACHNGQQSFSVKEDCTLCHRME